MTRPTALRLALIVCFVATSARAQAPAGKPAEPLQAPRADPSLPKDLYAVFETSRGKIGVKLLPQEAPVAVSNFIGLATGKQPYKDPATGEVKKGAYYDGTLFHRVIPRFMIQGGDPATRNASLGATSNGGLPFGVSGPGYRFEDELPKPGTKRLFEKPCVLAMANAGPNTNGSQFFITEGAGSEVPQLEPRACDARSGVCGYTRFGTGVCGCELVGQIARAGNSQTRIVRVSVQNEAPTCK
jgi:peptidyl-prolyl cis-trans isomerase A (cyclophilin A)